MISGLKTALSLCDGETQIVPGHGLLMAKEELESYVGMLEQFRAAIAKEIAAGKDLETIKSERPTAELDLKWGERGGFPPPVFTEIVYLSLTGK